MCSRKFFYFVIKNKKKQGYRPLQNCPQPLILFSLEALLLSSSFYSHVQRLSEFSAQPGRPLRAADTLLGFLSVNARCLAQHVMHSKQAASRGCQPLCQRQGRKHYDHLLPRQKGSMERIHASDIPRAGASILLCIHCVSSLDFNLFIV